MGDIDIYPYPEQNNGITDIAQQASAPPAPDVGDLWLDTDENAGVGLSSILAYAEKTNGNFTLTGATVTDIPELTVTITVPAGRRIKITAQGGLYNNQATSNQAIWLLIREGTTQLQASNSGTHSPTGTYGDTAIVNTIWIGSPSAGTHTYKVSAVANNTNGIFTSSTSAPSFILVEDITGTLWPAGQSIGAGAIASEAWIDYTPIFTQLTVGNGVVTGAYQKIGRTVHWRARIVLGSTSSMGTGGLTTVSLPVACSAWYITGVDPMGIVQCGDTGTADYMGVARIVSTTTVSLLVPKANVTFLEHDPIDTNRPFTWVNGDRLSVTGTYEAAN